MHVYELEAGHIFPRQPESYGNESLHLPRVRPRANAVPHLEKKGGGRSGEHVVLSQYSSYFPCIHFTVTNDLCQEAYVRQTFFFCPCGICRMIVAMKTSRAAVVLLRSFVDLNTCCTLTWTDQESKSRSMCPKLQYRAFWLSMACLVYADMRSFRICSGG